MVNTNDTSKAPFIAAGITFLVVIFMVYLVTHFAAVLKVRKQELAKTTADLSRLDAIVSDMKTNSTKIAAFRMSLPGQYADVAQTMRAMEVLGKSLSLDIATTLADEAKADSGVHALTITQEVNGSYTSIQNYMAGLSRLPYHTHTETITIEGTGNRLDAEIVTKLFIE